MNAYEEPKHTASLSFAFTQLLWAIDSSRTHVDLDAQSRAKTKAEAWRNVVAGMQDGSLKIGSRTPVAEAPSWVTLKVYYGGFASGSYCAGGELVQHERELASRLQVDDDLIRPSLNRYFLSDDGLAEMTRAVEERQVRIDVPEEAALPICAYLLNGGRYDEAVKLLKHITPWFDRLRFFPRIEAGNRAPNSHGNVHRLSIGELRSKLGQIRNRPKVVAQHRILKEWIPLRDQLVELWLSTMNFGWPCQKFPEDWNERRAKWLSTYMSTVMAPNHRHARFLRYVGHRSNFAVLRDALFTCAHDSSALNGYDVGKVRRALKDTIARRGEAGSQRMAAAREQQQKVLKTPLIREVAKLVVERLEGLPQDGGIPVEQMEELLKPVITSEARTVTLPEKLVNYVRLATDAPLSQLVHLGIVPSGEVLARILPQLTSHCVAGSISDPGLAHLYAELYRAFRRRRSLLLLNLEHQVSLDELPWVEAVKELRVSRDETTSNARNMLRDVVLLVLRTFPGVMVPNPLVRELTTLSKEASLDMPLVEELAADIYMDCFTPKFRSAASVASSLLAPIVSRNSSGDSSKRHGSRAPTLYARYYDLPEWYEMNAKTTTRWDTKVSEDFSATCKSRAEDVDSYRIERNRAEIEQAQVLTTHNLAAFTHYLNLSKVWEAEGCELAKRAFQRAIELVTREHDSEHREVSAIRQAAYAWRQTVFFLSFASNAAQFEWIDLMQAEVARKGPNASYRFKAALGGLSDVARGLKFDSHGYTKNGRRVLGTMSGKHPLRGRRTQRQ